MLSISKLVFFLLVITFVNSQSLVTWTDLPQIRMGQTSIFDDNYFPLNQISVVDVNYPTAFAVANPIVHQAVVFSGFQNYLHYQIRFNITLQSVLQNKITVNIFVGTSTYIKQLNINYFVMQQGGTAAKHTFISVSVGNYLTLGLVDPAGARQQIFNNQTSLIPNVKTLISAIHGLDYQNTDGVLNQINVNTQMITGTNKIQQQVNVGQKGKLYYISLTTIVIAAGFYPTPNAYLHLGYTFEDTITDVDGFVQLNTISAGQLFTNTKNSFFFGVRGFKFKMQTTRMFLLTIATQPIFRSNLETNAFMLYTQIAALIIVKRQCLDPTALNYWVQGFKCQAACTGLMNDATNKICQTCASVCNGCTTDKGDCFQCVVGNNRVKDPAAPFPNCVCNTNGGFVQVTGSDVCQPCSNFIPGCLKCTSTTFCVDCGDPLLFQFDPVGTEQRCRCRFGKFLVSGVCLSYPGCLQANTYITGQFCNICDTPNNFEKNLAANSSCICKTAYFINNNTWICQDKCGDFKTPDSPPNAVDSQIICDDGNTESGDGCSSSCRQQFGYICTVQTPGGVSICAQKQQIKINYLYSQKNLIGNQGVIAFALLPEQHFLAQNTFQNAISMNLPGTKKIKFDPVNSLILITVDYPYTIEENQYQFNFTFAGLSIYSPDIYVKAKLNGYNAKLEISQAPQQNNIITYVALGVSAFALALALISSFLGQKLIGIELILPIQAAFFSMATLPKNVLSPISALWSLKFSNGYNSLQKYDISTNYMLDPRIVMMQYSGQYILNYNIMFLLLALVILIIGIIALRIAWLEREQRRIQQIQKKKEQQDKNQPKKEKKQKTQNEKDQKQTQDQSKKQEQINMENLQEELQDTRQNMKNWKNFMYMVFDRFFSILIITAMMKVIFCFYIQLSNLTYTAEVYDNSLNAGFFFLTYAIIVTGLYSILYDYKTDKLILFTCNKGKYAMFYIIIFLVYIIILGAIFQTIIAVYISVVFSILPIVLIIYQVPYGLRRFDFQAIIAIFCQLPFVALAAISLLLNLQKDMMKQSMCLIFAYAIIGSEGLSIILTLIRLIKVIDCKKVSCIQFTDRKKQNANDKNKKKNKVALLEIDMDKDWDEEGSVRAVLYDRKKNEENDQFGNDSKNKQDSVFKNNKDKQKDKDKPQQQQEDDEDIDELEKIKMKLRKQLKQKKAIGKIK